MLIEKRIIRYSKIIVIFQSFLLRFWRGFRCFIRRKIFHNAVLSSRKELHCRFIAEELSTSYFIIIWCGIVGRQWTSFGRQVEYHQFFHLQVSFWMIECKIISLEGEIKWKGLMLSSSFNEFAVSACIRTIILMSLDSLFSVANWYPSFLALPTRK